MKIVILLMVLSVMPANMFAQTREETAAKNFETSLFIAFKNAYPADAGKTVFKNYSELWRRKALPEELKLMLEYDPQKFYIDYLYLIKNSRDTLIKITGLELSQAVKDTYTKFKQSVLEADKTGKFNTKQDKVYSEILKQNIDQSKPPVIGYYQSAVAVVHSPDGAVKESKIIITYTNELEAIDFSIVE